MAVPAHTRVTFSGVFGGATAPSEIWAFGLNTAPLITTAYASATVVDALKTAFGTHLGPKMSTDVALTKVRIAAVKGDGLVDRNTDGSYLQRDWAGTPVTGNVTTAVASRKPISTAWCVSLQTPRAGATGKGRFFLPFPPDANIETDFRVSIATTTAMLTSVKAFVNACVTALGTPVVVASGGSVKTGAPGVLTAVTSLKLGRTPDTMRSRRGALPEAYIVDTL